MPQELPILPGRGTPLDPPNRFHPLYVERDGDGLEDEPAPPTRFFADRPRRIISRNDSPDVGFKTSLNPYRGCEHGCVYCYARPSHEYLGYSAGLDFERKILVRTEAALLLRKELRSAGWSPTPLVLSGVTDPYQPVERRLQVTRGCLEVLVEARNPVAVVTKNRLVTRDVDLLSELAGREAASVSISITTLRRDLQRILEPRTSTPKARLDALAELTSAGIPTRVNVAPVIPGLTDEELPSILRAARDAGASSAMYIILRLPGVLSQLFEDWLSRHVPERRQKILSRIRSMRGGRLNDPRFGSRMRGEGAFAEQIRSLFPLECERLGLRTDTPPLAVADFSPPGPSPPPPPSEQLNLFREGGQGR